MAAKAKYERPEPGIDPISEAEGFEDIDESAEVSPLHYGITSYGADFPVDALVKRMGNGDIVVPTFDPQTPDLDSGVVGFQRDFVWTKPQCDRFIESLLLGFPVPGIFLVQGSEGLYLVLDGQQRLRTIHAFYDEVLRDEAFRLQYVQDNFLGKKFSELDVDARRRLDNSIMHATVVRQELPSDDQSGIYKLFERLNTGGTFLQPQEIRVALYNGELVNLLRDLNENDNWRALCGPRSKRLKDQEFILRFFAFRAGSNTYSAPMKDFLNEYTGRNRHLAEQSAAELTKAFEQTVSFIHEEFGARAFRPVRAVNAAVVDSVMTTVAEGIERSTLATGISSKFSKLMADEPYLEATARATAREENVELRLRLARKHLLKRTRA